MESIRAGIMICLLVYLFLMLAMHRFGDAPCFGV